MTTQSQLSGHGMDGPGLGVKRVDYVVAFLTTLLALPLSGIFAVFSRRFRLFGLHNQRCFVPFVFHGDRRQGQGRHNSLGNVTQVLEQVPPVRNLDSVRGSSLRTVRKGSGTVSADDGNRPMFPQPGGKDIGASLGENLHWAAGLEVAHDGAVPVAFAPRPLVDPNDP